jgi:hypothetical protein
MSASRSAAVFLANTKSSVVAVTTMPFARRIAMICAVHIRRMRGAERQPNAMRRYS